MECRIEYFKRCGLTADDFNKANILLVIVRINMVCRDACTFGDEIEFETSLDKINRKSIAFKYVARNTRTRRVVFKAETVNFVTSREGSLSSIPDYIYEKLANR